MIDELYASAYAVDAFASWTNQILEPYGFTAANTLPLVGVCRDELMFPIEQAVHEAWGLSFDMSSLAGMVFLGRSGLAAAAHHSPGADGRHRYLCILLPHIGLDAAMGVGYVQREGQAEPSSACGALIVLRDELRAGVRNQELDHGDIEMSLLRMTLLPLIGPEISDLVSLTEIARRASTDELVRLVTTLRESPQSDVAVVSGVVIHGPDGDRVAVCDAWVSIGSADQVSLI
jgi:Limiting CO2-inducible proteins B/C beta carbonyic anhydrases